ncbi:MAG: hypothetical protein E6Q97_39560 [Desulfurellales bacterium]|nr:MAG: hypothetical protein E6Q97_39560 [Desulfurellales bacterium]
MTNAEQMLTELVSRIENTRWERCHLVRDFQGWFSSWKLRHGIGDDVNEWIREIQDVDFGDDDEDDVGEFIAEILDEVEPDDVNFEGDE